MVLNERSLKALQGVHPDLVRVVNQAALSSPFPFIVTEGLRTIERQRILFAQKLSRTMNSRHLTGHAIVSGGDWRSFKDFPHIELDRKVYP